METYLLGLSKNFHILTLEQAVINTAIFHRLELVVGGLWHICVQQGR